MPRGPRCRTLTPSQIGRLEKFRRRGDVDHPHGFSYPQLKLSMNGNFSLDTLMRGMGGKPIQERFYGYIAEWLDRFLPERTIVDGKTAAAGRDGDSEEVPPLHVAEARAEELAGKKDEPAELSDAEKATAAARTIRGSR